MDTDQEKETEYVFVVGIECDRVMNTIVAVFTEMKDAKELESAIRSQLFGSATSHPNAVFTHVVPFNPKRSE